MNLKPTQSHGVLIGVPAENVHFKSHSGKALKSPCSLPFNTSRLQRGEKLSMHHRSGRLPLSDSEALAYSSQNSPGMDTSGNSLGRASSDLRRGDGARPGDVHSDHFLTPLSEDIARFITILTMHRSSALDAPSSTDLRADHPSAGKMPVYGFNGCAHCSQRTRNNPP
jgi:hypothetical protein